MIELWLQDGTCFSHMYITSGVQEYLERAGIVPSDTVTYEASAIENALAGPFGAKPEVMCACPRGGWRTTCDTAKIDSVSRAETFLLCSRTRCMEKGTRGLGPCRVLKRSLQHSGCGS